MAEWSCRGLQILVHRFDSGLGLQFFQIIQSFVTLNFPLLVILSKSERSLFRTRIPHLLLVNPQRQIPPGLTALQDDNQWGVFNSAFPLVILNARERSPFRTRIHPCSHFISKERSHQGLQPFRMTTSGAFSIQLSSLSS